MVNDYMIGTTSNRTTATELALGNAATGIYDYGRLVYPKYQEPKEPKNKSKLLKMEVELCLCSKALWS